MRRQVWKYVLAPYEQPIIPLHAELLYVGLQDGVPHLWALVDPDYTVSAVRDILILPTGVDAPQDIAHREYIGTVVGVDGQYVLHVWDQAEAF